MTLLRTSVDSSSSKQVLLACLGLMLLVIVVFAPSFFFGFINFDDPGYVVENPIVSKGVTLDGLRWMFRETHGANFHPLTTLSHMLDCQFFGLNAGLHRLMNVIFHAASVLLLFLLLKKMTGFLWRSAMVAALFAVHPLRVESVVWIAERKDVLSGFFFMLTLLAYLGYVKRCALRDTGCGMCDVGEPGARGLLSSVFRPLSSGSYWLVVLFFTLGLMSKPMLVTLPFVLLLLDFWPLGRFGRYGVEGYGSVGLTAKERKKKPKQPFLPKSNAYSLKSFLFLALEKIPLVTISVFFSTLTYIAQSNPRETLDIPLFYRVGNAMVSYATYIWQFFVPTRLALVYPHPGIDLSLWKVGASALILIGITFWVIRSSRCKPFPSAQSLRPKAFLLVGWFWFVGMLVPVIGLVQVGVQAHADRYTYLPQIGMAIVVVWAVAELNVRRTLRVMLAAVVLAALTLQARIQVGYWSNSIELWTHTLESTKNNTIAWSALGEALYDQGEVVVAQSCFLSALEVNPQYEMALYDMGFSLIRQGRPDEGIPYLKQVLILNPKRFDARKALGAALLLLERPEDALVHLKIAEKMKPRDKGLLGNIRVAEGMILNKERLQHEE
jgi:hypothetical protein